MSRVIKFRAWDCLQGTYIKSAWSSGGVRITEGGGLQFDIPDYWTLEQFTGLLDKNGKEIYEGDVVKTTPSGSCLSSIFDTESFISYSHGEIEMVLGSWKICQAGIGATIMFDYTDCDCCPCQSIEVIGNIHENPELLKS